MKFVNMYLLGYLALVIGVVLALWQTGVLNGVPPLWIGIGVLIAAGLGVMMAVSGGKPDITKEG